MLNPSKCGPDRWRTLSCGANIPARFRYPPPSPSPCDFLSARVVSDRASFYLIIEGTAETPGDAITRVDTKVKAVTNALKPLVSRITLDAPIAYGVGPSPAPNGYPGPANPPTHVARSVIRVQFSRVDQVADVVAAAISAGASGASALTFESSIVDSVRRVRITEAIGVAHADADAIARSLGLHLGSLIA